MSQEAEAVGDRPRAAKPSNRFHWFGFTATGIWVAVVIAYAWLARDKWAGMSPNEYGDFFAGAFAPLAFLWLVLGFFQQGQELRNSAEALWLQGVELKNSVEQQRGLAEATRDHVDLVAEIYLDQQENRDRLARPSLKLETASSVQSAGTEEKLQYFRLKNLGKRCTHVALRTDVNAKTWEWDDLDGRKPKDFALLLPRKDGPAFKVTVDFIDELQSKGSVTFSVESEGEKMFIKQVGSTIGVQPAASSM